jgi:RNA polymerase sigma-70 factor (ECF subfamily)
MWATISRGGAAPDARPEEPSDAALVEAAVARPAAFDALYRRYLPAVYRYVRARVGSVEDAEDVTSAIFIDALAGLRGYREEGRFAAWLFTIARRRLVAHYRRSGQVDLIDADDVSAPTAASDELLDLLTRAMHRLTADRREALTLRFFAGLPIQDVAHTMGKGESATKMLIHRGLLQLRDLLAEDMRG